MADAAPELAAPLLDVYESQLDDTVIGWSISVDRESPAYMRIDGPRVWIEWLNRANPGEAGFHPHTVYRDKLIDYGTGTDVVPDVVEDEVVESPSDPRRVCHTDGQQTPIGRTSVARADQSSSFKALMNTSPGTSTRPIDFIFFLPSFCFSSNLRLRVMSPP